MASLMEAPGLTQEEIRGSGGNAAKDRDAVLAGDHAEGTELSVEGDRSVDVGDPVTGVDERHDRQLSDVRRLRR